MPYADIVGQEDVIARLRAFGGFYKKTGGTPGHIPMPGEDGMGKRAIAQAFASEQGVPFQEIDARQVKKKGHLTALLTNLRDQQVLLISNTLSLREPLLDFLLGAVRDRVIEITIGEGKDARTHRMDLRHFTLIATATKKTDCSTDLLNAFSLVLPLGPYSDLELRRIVEAIALREGVSIETTAAELIASKCAGRPCQIEALIQRLLRAGAVQKDAILQEEMLTEERVLQAFSAFGINARSSPLDHFILPQQMSGEEFERLITSLLTRMGFHAEMTRATGDGGIDIVAFLDKPILGGKYLFQCKRFAPDNLVGAPTVRDFYGAVTADRAVKGILITTSNFTAQAREFAERVGLELIAGNELESLMAQYQKGDISQ